MTPQMTGRQAKGRESEPSRARRAHVPHARRTQPEQPRGFRVSSPGPALQGEGSGKRRETQDNIRVSSTPPVPRREGHFTRHQSKADDPAFRDYVNARGRALLRTAYLLTGNLADAEDLVQSALAKTYLAWERIQDRAALDGYVRKAMVNTHISWWRRRRLDEFPTDDIPDQAVADHSAASDQHEMLQRAIDRLPERMREAVMLRFYDDMTEAEVAEVLGVSLGTVKSTVSRAVAKLRIDSELQPD